MEGLQRSKQKRGSRPLDERTRTPAGMVHQMGGYGQSKWVAERHESYKSPCEESIG